MMQRLLISVFLLSAVNTGLAMAASSPAAGSAERRAILDAARRPAEARLHQDIQFHVHQLNVTDGWAFLHAQMQRRGGRPVDFSGTPDAEAALNGGKSNSFAALLRRQAERWRVVAFVVGPTDVAWAGWSQEYNAPPELFGSIAN